MSPTLEELVEKLDAFTKTVEDRLVKLETPIPPDPAPKEDARDVSLQKGMAFFKTYLKEMPKEKLDSYDFNQLVALADFKCSQKLDVGNPPPPIDLKTDNNDGIPDYLRAEVFH